MGLGGSWAPFGKGLGRSGVPFGHFWALWGHFFGVLNQPFFKHKLKMGSKRPFGSILGRFGRVLDGFGEDFGRVWIHFGSVLDGSGRVGLTLFKFFYVRTPALSREAPRSVPMRGGPLPLCVK